MNTRRVAVRIATTGLLAMAQLSQPAVVAQEADPSTPTPPLDEIVVTSSRVPMPIREIGTAMSVIAVDEIELRGYHSMADLLRTQPGIGVSNAGGPGKVTTVRIRGEEGYRTLVLIDGIEVSDPTGTQVGFDFSQMTTTSELERVEILRGPQGFMYGADAGGVVNIITRAGEDRPGARASLELGAFSTQKLDVDVHGGSDTGDFLLAVSDIGSEGFNSRADDVELMDNDGYDNTTIHTKLGWNVRDDLRLQLVARGVESRTEFDSCGFPTTHDCIADTRQTTFRLSADHNIGDFTHLFAYSEADTARDNLADGTSSFATTGKLSRVEYTGSYSPTDLATLVYGLDLRSEDVVASDGNDLSRSQRAVYFEAQGRFGEHIFATAGLRRDDNDAFGVHDSVRVTTAYQRALDGRTTIKYRVGYGTGFRAPSLSEIAYNDGPFAYPPAADVVLKEESSAGYDLGVLLARENGLALEATYFDQEIEDEIFFDLSGFSGYLQTRGRNDSTGIELTARIPVGSRWQLWTNFTWNDTRDGTGLQRIRRPKQLGNFGLSFAAPGSRLRLLANLRVSRDAVDEVYGVGRVPLEDYEVLDIAGSYRLSDRFELFGRIENAADQRYAEVAGYLTGGRAASIGVRLTL